MNARWVRIGLFLLVATVWGAVLVKAFFRKPPVVENNTPLPQRAVPTEVAHEAPPLNLHWARDPFLNEAAPAQRVVERSTAAPAAARSVAAAPKVEVAMAWPQVVYKGAVRGQARTIAMLTVNGRSVTVAQGGTEQGLLVKRATADTLVLALGDEARVFVRQ